MRKNGTILRFVMFLGGAAATGWIVVAPRAEPRHFDRIAAMSAIAGASCEQADLETPADDVAGAAALARLGLPERADDSPRTYRVVEAFRAADAAAIGDLRVVALTTADPLIAGNAIRALGRLGALMGDRRLLALVTDSRPRVRQELVMALGACRDRRALDPLLALLDRSTAEADGDLRALLPLVLYALGELGDFGAARRVSAIADDLSRSEHERAFARAAMRRLVPRRT